MGNLIDITNTPEEEVVTDTVATESSDTVEIEKSVDKEETPSIDMTPDADGIVDVDLSPIKKKAFRINGDMNKIIYLNVSDMNIVGRLQSALIKLRSFQNDALQVAIDSDNDEESLNNMVTALKEIDEKMRELVDYIFDSPVSEVCASDGSMYDPFEGEFRYEHIIETLTKLYKANITSEYKKLQSKIFAKTAKYTGKKRK